MGNEGPWWIVAGAVLILMFAAVGFIAIKIPLLFIREWRRRRDG